MTPMETILSFGYLSLAKSLLNIFMNPGSCLRKFKLRVRVLLVRITQSLYSVRDTFLLKVKKIGNGKINGFLSTNDCSLRLRDSFNSYYSVY